MLPDDLRTMEREPILAKSLVLSELEDFLSRQSTEVQASLLAFVHLIEPDCAVRVNLDIQASGELSLALSGRERECLSSQGD